MSGRRSVLYCALSGWLCSLASAGNVCWAKPNHGFSECQQPHAIFFYGYPLHPARQARLWLMSTRCKRAQESIAVQSRCAESQAQRGFHDIDDVRHGSHLHVDRSMRSTATPVTRRIYGRCAAEEFGASFRGATRQSARTCANFLVLDAVVASAIACTAQEKVRVVADAVLLV